MIGFCTTFFFNEITILQIFFPVKRSAAVLQGGWICMPSAPGKQSSCVSCRCNASSIPSGSYHASIYTAALPGRRVIPFSPGEWGSCQLPAFFQPSTPLTSHHMGEFKLLSSSLDGKWRRSLFHTSQKFLVSVLHPLLRSR